MSFEASALFDAFVGSSVGSSNLELDLDVNDDGDVLSLSEIVEVLKLFDDAELDCWKRLISKCCNL